MQIAGATLDLVLDGWRVTSVRPPEKQAVLSSWTEIGWRVGHLGAGAGALYLADHIGWKGAYPPQFARAHRRRRRKGQRCVSITLDPVEIDGLVKKGYLPSTDRDNAAAIQFAAECCLSDVLLGFTP
jgi:hypothetical protein